MQTFAEQLNAARKERHITQEQLAQELNVSRTTISRWESGKVLPDIETIKRLSQVLNCNFFTVAGLADTAPAEKVAAKETPADETPVKPEMSPVRKRSKGWMYAAGGLCLLVLCLFVVFGIINKPPLEPTQKQQTANAAAGPKSDRAEIVVTPSDTIVYLQNFSPDSGKRGRGWSVDFSFENKSDVPFNIEKIVYYYYQDGVVRNYGEVPFSDIRHLMNNDKLLSINDPLVFGFGTDHLFYTDFKCTICGTDDNGNYIEASATVQYSKEYADAASNQ